MGMEIRKFKITDSIGLVDMITVTIKTSNSGYYQPEYINYLIGNFTADRLIQRARWTDFYIACEGDLIVGCGAIGSLGGKVNESCLYNVFVLPSYQRKGIGSKIINKLEKSEYYTRAHRIEVVSFITSVEFYKKFGYEKKDEFNATEYDLLCRLEKINAKTYLNLTKDSNM